MIREFAFGMPASQVAQDPSIREKTWDAIWVSEDGEPPPVEFKFPWWLVGLGAVAAVAIRTRHIMKKGEKS